MNHTGRLREQRQIRAVSTEFQCREDGSPVIEGYFAVFDSVYQIADGLSESIAPGAFSASLSGDVRALVNHDSTLVLGRTKNGTLELREDARGLFGRVFVNPEDSAAMDLYRRVQRGDVDGCSIGFSILKESHTKTDSGGTHWTIEEVKLYEVSACTFPAYTETDIAARKRDLAEAKRRELDAWKNEIRGRLRYAENQTAEHGPAGETRGTGRPAEAGSGV